MSEPSIRQQIEKDSRVSIINTVQTPLGFFVLVVLIVEVVFGITASISTGSDRTYLIVGMLTLIFLLVLIVAGMAVFRPVSLYGMSTQPPEKTSVPQGMLLDKEQSQPSLVQFYTEIRMRTENALKYADRQRSLAEETARLVTDGLPRQPEGIEPEKWQSLREMIRFQHSQSYQLFDELSRLWEDVHKHSKRQDN